jgi:hypothetical protein
MVVGAPSTKAALRMLHGGAKPETIFVILSRDGSTVVKDPGLGRPWSSRNRKLAEDHAKRIGHGATVCDLLTAANHVLRHPKNLPKGFKGKFPI